MLTLQECVMPDSVSDATQAFSISKIDTKTSHDFTSIHENGLKNLWHVEICKKNFFEFSPFKVFFPKTLKKAHMVLNIEILALSGACKLSNIEQK